MGGKGASPIRYGTNRRVNKPYGFGAKYACQWIAFLAVLVDYEKPAELASLVCAPAAVIRLADALT